MSRGVTRVTGGDAPDAVEFIEIVFNS